MDLQDKTKELKKTVLEMCIKAETGHVSSCFSCTEIMVALYYSVMKPEDKFILSKGHASPLLYAILADKGYFPKEELETFCMPGSRLGVHLNNDVPGVECISGSLGYGLGIGAGMAYADRTRRVFVLLGDGECQEGSVWEAAMFIGKYKLSNLTAIIDCNGYAATPSNRPTTNWDWNDFGWDMIVCNGHSESAMVCALTTDLHQPTLIQAQTIKGYGLSCFENAPLTHGCAPVGDQIELCRREVDA